MFLDKGTAIGSGVVMLVIGIVFLAFPAFTMSLFTVMVGIAFLFGGISMLVAWWKGPRGAAADVAAAVLGVLSVVFALVCLLHPLTLASTLTWLVALCVVIAGFAQLVALIMAGGLVGRTLGIAATLLMIVFGIFALVDPRMVVQFIGISLIIEGCSAIILGVMSNSRS